jgi:hypothetical protein
VGTICLQVQGVTGGSEGTRDEQGSCGNHWISIFLYFGSF